MDDLSHTLPPDAPSTLVLLNESCCKNDSIVTNWIFVLFPLRSWLWQHAVSADDGVLCTGGGWRHKSGWLRIRRYGSASCALSWKLHLQFFNIFCVGSSMLNVMMALMQMLVGSLERRCLMPLHTISTSVRNKVQ